MSNCWCGAKMERCGNGWSHSTMHDNRFDHAAAPEKPTEERAGREATEDAMKAEIATLTAAEQGPAWSLIYKICGELPAPEKEVWKIAALLNRRLAAQPSVQKSEDEVFNEVLAEEIWERHSELTDIIQCDMISDAVVMRQKDFYAAVRDYIRELITAERGSK